MSIEILLKELHSCIILYKFSEICYNLICF